MILWLIVAQRTAAEVLFGNVTTVVNKVNIRVPPAQGPAALLAVRPDYSC
jgi:hypothetical protein